ncbi:MAG: glycosyltransferase 87 family protein, partial [Vicinamibacteria bacterium]|nr:glycosyltransferase 87 family protein [Vicinamibacteria bacterium]
MRPPSSGRKWVWRAAAFCLAAVQLPVLYRTGADPSQSDFANYFAPARVLARGGAMGSLYDRDAFAIAMSEAGISGLGSFVPHPPANALWLLPLASLSAGVAKGVWSAVLVGALFLTLLALGRLREGPGPWEASVIVLAPTLAIRNGLAFGQPYLILAA